MSLRMVRRSRNVITIWRMPNVLPRTLSTHRPAFRGSEISGQSFKTNFTSTICTLQFCACWQSTTNNSPIATAAGVFDSPTLQVVWWIPFSQRSQPQATRETVQCSMPRKRFLKLNLAKDGFSLLCRLLSSISVRTLFVR